MLRRLCFLCLLCSRSLAAQQPVTRADAIAAALSRGARAAVCRADTAAAAAALPAPDALWQVQPAWGLPGAPPTTALADSILLAPGAPEPAPIAEPLPVAAAAADLRAQERTLTLAHRSLLPAPSFQVGVEQGDPAAPSQALPTFGVALAIPLFNWNGGEVRLAAAARARAQANLDLVQRESQSAL